MHRLISPVLFSLILSGCAVWIDKPTEPPAEQHVAPLSIYNAPSSEPHEVDGRFTGWELGGDLVEWRDIEPARLGLSNLYADYSGGTLHLLLDGTVDGLGSTDGSCPLQVRVVGDGGEDPWFGYIVPMSGGRFMNLVEQPREASLDSRHRRTPLWPNASHWAHEFSLPIEPGPFAMLVQGSAGEGCEQPATEPVPLGGELFADGGVRLDLHERPVLVTSWPQSVQEGDLVSLQGAGLDGITEVTVDRRAVPVKYGDGSRLQFQMPPMRGDTAKVRVTRTVRRGELRSEVLTLSRRDDADPNSGGGYQGPPMHPITIDGKFTDFVEGEPNEGEWSDVSPLTGNYTHLYVAYANQTLYMLNDWHYNDVTTPAPDCYNEFSFAVGNPASDYTVRVHNNGEVTVLVDGVLLAETDLEVEGGHTVGTSPLTPDKPHTIWELAVSAPPGGSNCQLHDPGPSPQNGCTDLATEPRVFEAELLEGGGMFSRLTEGPVVLAAPSALEIGEVVQIRVPNVGAGGAALLAGVHAPLSAGEGQDRWTFVVPEMIPGEVELVVETADGERSRPRLVTVQEAPPRAVWTQVAGTSPARAGHAGITDVAGGRVLMFGGEGASGLRSDTLVFEDGAISSLGVPLYPRTLAGMATLPSGAIVLVGGQDLGSSRDDVAQWNGATWEVLTPQGEGPPGRSDFGIASGPTEVLIFGGREDGGVLPMETLSFDGAAWEVLEGGGPDGRTGPAMVWLPGEDAALMFGGANAAGAPDSELWLLSPGPGWMQVDAGPGPIARTGASLALLGGVPVLYGGRDISGQPQSDVWMLDGDLQWVPLDVQGPAPAPRSDAAWALDPDSQQLMLHGGRGTSGLLGDTWLMRLE